MRNGPLTSAHEPPPATNRVSSPRRVATKAKKFRAGAGAAWAPSCFFAEGDYFGAHGTDYCSTRTVCSTDRAGCVLVVRLRTFQKAAVLRRLTQGHGSGADQNGNQGGQNCRLVRLQAQRRQTVLRRGAQPAGVRIEASDDASTEPPEWFGRQAVPSPFF
jgi:hypothetical protein